MMHKPRAMPLLLGVLLLLGTIAGTVLFTAQRAAWLTLCITALVLLLLFARFEHTPTAAKELSILAAMTAITVTGRFLFAPIPGFKPITALVIITAVCLGKESGFAVGALSAVLSNFYFGQGAWTPFQMLAWGGIGYLAGLLRTPLSRCRLLLYLFGALSGPLFSMVMDLWSTLWIGGGFSFSRYIAILLSSAAVTVEYAVSNVLFLLLLTTPITRILDRMKNKYGLFHITSKKEGNST